ncbi:unnamed protein product [Auanema sp. JU1783]|nr:unnamed protein product [Auanema sp. JU1783]
MGKQVLYWFKSTLYKVNGHELPNLKMKTLLLISSALISSTYAAAFSITQLAPNANTILDKALVPGRDIRQCSCEEENRCRKNMEEQMNQCSEQCYTKFRPIIADPFRLKPCLQTVQPVLHSFIDCMQKNLHSCAPDRNGPTIPYHDMRRIFQLGEQMMSQQKGKLLSTGVAAKMRPVSETILSYGECLETCFVNKNANGFCFDSLGCQPKITKTALQSSLKTCGKVLNWKHHAGSMCTCAEGAGVQGLHDICPLLRVMG